MKIQAAINLASYVKEATPQKIIPSPFEKWVAKVVAKAIK
jgi:malic enzyme